MYFPFRIRSSRVVTPQRRAVSQRAFVWRWDLSMLLVLVCGFLLLWLGVRFAERQGAFDGSGEFERVTDARKLADVDAEIREHGILATAPRGGHLAVSLQGARLREYDVTMDIWRDLPSLPETLVGDRDVVQLRAGNGNRDEPFDAARDGLFAMTGSGALAVLRDQRWDVISRDTQFLGRTGKPVAWSDVTAAAVSKDQRFLLLGTQTADVGLYDVVQRAWRSVPALAACEQVGPVREIAWWDQRNCFVLGGAKRLGFVRDVAAEAAIELSPQFVRQVVDLQVTREGRLWVMEQGDGNQPLKRISRWDADASEPFIEFDEGTRFAGLTLDVLNFAHQIGDTLYLAGPGQVESTAGVFGYDCDRHSWSRVMKEPVTCTLIAPDGQSFFAGSSDRVRQLPNGGVWRLDHAARQLTWGRSNEVLVQLTDDRVLSLRAGQEPVEVFHAPQTNVDLASVQSAFDVDATHVLLVTPSGCCVHQTRTRSYDDVVVPDSEKWLKEPRLRGVTSGQTAFFHDPTGKLHVLPQRSLTDASQRFAGRNSLALAGGAGHALFAMSPNNAGVLDADHMLYRAEKSASTPQYLAGMRIPDGEKGLVPRDVSGTDNDSGFLFPERGQLGVYRLDDRSWKNYSLPTGEDVIEISDFNKRLLMTTADGDLYDYRSSENDRWPLNGATKVMLGGDEPVRSLRDANLGIRDADLGIPDAKISDVWRDTDGDLYLAGAGRVTRYSPRERRVIERWCYGTDSDVRLTGVVGQRPVAVVDGMVWHGPARKLNQDWRAETVSLSGQQLWISTKGPDGLRRLVWYPDITAPRPDHNFVFFRNPTAEAQQFVDAVPLADGDVLVSTDAGLRVYSPRARSWYWFKDKNLLPNAELYELGKNHILVAQKLGEDRFQLATFHRGSLLVPHDGQRQVLEVSGGLWRSNEVRAFAVDRAKPELMWIENDSSILRWTLPKASANGDSSPMLATPGVSPKANDLQRVVACGDDWVFATQREVWTYDAAQHTWRKRPLVFATSGAAGIQILGIEKDPREQRVWVSVKRAGELHVGSWSRAAGGSIPLTMLASQPVAEFAGEPSRIIDVQQRGPLWTLLQSDRVDWYSPSTRSHLSGAAFPNAEGTMQLGTIDKRQIAANDRGRFWIGDQRNGLPKRFRYCDLKKQHTLAVDAPGNVWQLEPTGVVSSSTASGTEPEFAAFSRKLTPMLLKPEEVLAVFARQELSILLTKTGERIYDEQAHQEVPVEVVSVSDTARDHAADGWREFESKDGYWLIGRDSVLQLDLRQSPRGQKPKLFRGLTEFVPFPGGQHWAKSADQWFVWDAAARSFMPVPLGTLTGATEMKIFVTAGMSPTAIRLQDKSLQVWKLSDWSKQPNTSLPNQISVGSVRQIVPDGRDWWVLQAEPDRIVRLSPSPDTENLVVTEQHRLPEAIVNGLGGKLRGARLAVGGVEFLGDHCGVRARVHPQQPSQTPGGLQWWTTDAASLPPLARAIAQNAIAFYLDEAQHAGWIVKQNERQVFALTTPESVAPADVVTHQGVRVGVVKGAAVKLSLEARRALASEAPRIVSDISLPAARAIPAKRLSASVIQPADGTRLVPAADSAPFTTVMAGDLPVLERVTTRLHDAPETWYRVGHPDSTLFWTQASNIDRATGRVSASLAWMRAEPKADAPRTGFLQKGKLVCESDGTGSWVELQSDEVEIGYLPAAQLKLKDSAAQFRDDPERVTGFRKAEQSVSFEVSTPNEVASEFREVSVSKPVAKEIWQKRFGKNPNGSVAYQAVSALVIEAQQIVAKRPSDSVTLAPAGGLLTVDQLQQDGPLDAKWLKWNRAKKQFEVTCAGGSQFFAPTEFIDAKRFLFEEAQTLVYSEAGRPYVANRYGVWSYSPDPMSKDAMSLTNPRPDSVTFRPHAAMSAPTAFRGGFLYPNRQFIKAEPSLTVTDQHPGENLLTFGPVGFVETAKPLPLQVTLSMVFGSPITTGVLSDQGFLWDRRRSLAINASGPLLHSEAGIHQHAPAEKSEFAPSPAASGRLFSEEASTTWFQESSRWQRLDGGRWGEARSPRLDRELVNSSDWVWKRKPTGEIEIARPKHPLGFHLVTNSNEPAHFTTDILGDAAVHDGQLHLLTQASHQVLTLPANANSGLVVGAALNSGMARIAFPQTFGWDEIDFDVRKNKDGDLRLYRLLGTASQMATRAIEAWDRSQSQFAPIKSGSDADPRTLQKLVETSRLRFERRSDKDIQKKIRLEQVDGSLQWRDFSLSQTTSQDRATHHRFPFDRVNSTAARFGRLFVGSDAGLQIYGETEALAGNLDLHQSKLRLLEVHHTEAGNLRVDRVGVPFGMKEEATLAARSDGHCLATLDGQQFTDRPTEKLDTRLRHRNGLWQWREAAAPTPRLDGQYINHSGQYGSAPIDFADGRLPHDRLVDAIHFAGQTFTLWHDGWISAHAGDAANLDAGCFHWDMRSTKPIDLFVVRHDNLQLKLGLYYRSRDNRVWQYSKTTKGWNEIDEKLASGLIAYATNEPTFSKDRLRLVRELVGEKNLFRFEHRTITTGTWREIPWINRNAVTGSMQARFSLACDVWQQCLYDSSTDALWAATPMGFCRFTRSKEGRAEIPSTEFVAIRELVEKRELANQSVPFATELRQNTQLPNPRSGETRLQKPSKGEVPVLVRLDFDSKQVHIGTLSPTRDTNTFSPAANDPFREEEISTARTDYWQWKRVDQVGSQTPKSNVGKPGHLECDWRGDRRAVEAEPLDLSSGRFSFDSVDSFVASPEAMHLASEASGWLTSARDDLHLKTWRRPISATEAKNVTRVFPSRNLKREDVVALRKKNGDTVTPVGNSLDSIRQEEFVGDDGFWSYWRSETKTTDPKATTAPRLRPVLVEVSQPDWGTANRRLEKGRFSDDIVIGLPIQRTASPTSAETNSYVIPTRAGFEQRDRAFVRQRIDSTPIQADALSATAYLSTDNRVYYLVKKDSETRQLVLRPLASADSPSEKESGSGNRDLLEFPFPDGAVAVNASRDLAGHLRIRWQTDERRGWQLLNVSEPSAPIPNDDALAIRVGEWRRFQQNQYAWGNPDPHLWLQFDHDHERQVTRFLSPHRDADSLQIASNHEPLLDAHVIDHRVFAVHPTGIWMIQLDRPLVTAFSGR
ncbi:MAG: hypothetical protein ACKV2Q_05740 [Planctomycetaceae bacterium]